VSHSEIPTRLPESEGLSAVAQEAGAQPGAAASASRWTAGRVATLTIGVLLGLVALALVAAGGTALWADRTQRDAGYATTGTHSFSTEGSALATESTDLGSAGIGWLYSPGVLGTVRIRVTPTGAAGKRLFVGVAHSTDVDRYLAGVNHTVITDFRGNKTAATSGSKPAAPPGSQHFWAASTSGAGRQTLVWKPKGGSWSVVAMNTDGSAGVAVRADLGAKVPALPWIGLGLLLAGVIFLAGGVVLVVGAVRRGSQPSTT
jgi:hypothetical protein